jgi:DNA mismatch repair ATPase MutS
MGHPLLPDAQKVCNDFTIDRPGFIGVLTGSNMSGKSTFLRTAGINLVLAYSGGPVDATHFHTAFFRLHTCIRISDSITTGISHFYAEVKCLKSLMNSLQAGHPLPLFYLIDEIFQGTNNRERLTGSRSFIRALANQAGVGLISTHDLELAHLAEEIPSLHNYHFKDTVSDGRLHFDYHIQPGPSPTTNALKIMALEGLPVDE